MSDELEENPTLTQPDQPDPDPENEDEDDDETTDGQPGWKYIQFAPPDPQDNIVFNEFLTHIANGQLRRYKGIIHYSEMEDGGKAGMSYYNHVLDLTSLVAQLMPQLKLDDIAQQCIYLALVLHDINKIPPYFISATNPARPLSYANAATEQNFSAELEKLEAERFFPAWRNYLHDIVYLAHEHQVGKGTGKVLDQNYLNNCRLPGGLLKGTLSPLMQAVDGADNIHSADWQAGANARLNLINRINQAMPRQQYRWLSYRLPELRGLFTNLINNQIKYFLIERYKPENCIELLNFPEGTDFLLATNIQFTWNDADLTALAQHIDKELARVQSAEVAKFIKGQPWGIAVDDAAIDSGATTSDIFDVVLAQVGRKHQPGKTFSEWLGKKQQETRRDLSDALPNAKLPETLKTQLNEILASNQLISSDAQILRRGEMLLAYANFLTKHRAGKLREFKKDNWAYLYQLFELPPEKIAVYNLVNTYRRAYFLAPDLPHIELDALRDQIVADLDKLDLPVPPAHANPTTSQQATMFETSEDIVSAIAEPPAAKLPTSFIYDYLKTNLSFYLNGQTLAVPDFKAGLQQYLDPQKQYRQCCYCNSAFKTEEWMAAQVPGNIGVQFFSNRLRGGDNRDPKRRVCPICRTQFILEKLAWKIPAEKVKDKIRGRTIVKNTQVYYLHLFPYSFFTQPLRLAWQRSIERLGDATHDSFFIDKKSASNYLSELSESTDQLKDYLVDIKTRGGYGRGVGGINTGEMGFGNVPILPIFSEGKNAGLQFLNALEKAVVLVTWFDCRAILSTSPVPPQNISNAKINNQPIALLIDGRPRNLTWLLPETSFYRDSPTRPSRAKNPPLRDAELGELYQRLGLIYRLAGLLETDGVDVEEYRHDLMVCANDDPLALYYAADRWLEKKVTAETKSSDAANWRAIYLTGQIAPLLKRLNNPKGA